LTKVYKTISNLGDVVVGEMLLRFANVAIAALIGRSYGASVLGIYATIIAVATLAERLADNGLELTGIAEVSARPQKVNEIVSALYIDKTILSTAAIGLLALMGWIAGFTPGQWLIAILITLRTFAYSYSRLNASFLKGLNRTRYIAIFQATHFVLLVICLFSVYFRHPSLALLLFCVLAAQIAEFSFSSAVLCRLGVRGAVIRASLCWDLLRRSTAVGMPYTLWSLMMRADVVILSLVASAAVVGTFAAANTGLVLVYVVAWLFSGILLSDLGSLSRNTEGFDLHFRKVLRTVVLVSILLAAIGALFAKFAVILLFGGNFAAAGLSGAIMMLALPLIFLNATFLSRLIAKNETRAALLIFGPVTILSFLLNYLLGQSYGATGVAFSIVLREAVISVFCLHSRDLPGRLSESSVTVDSRSEITSVLNT
jgi:O-antigen/teichoic acid export membrane protein